MSRIRIRSTRRAVYNKKKQQSQCLQQQKAVYTDFAVFYSMPRALFTAPRLAEGRVYGLRKSLMKQILSKMKHFLKVDKQCLNNFWTTSKFDETIFEQA